MRIPEGDRVGPDGSYHVGARIQLLSERDASAEHRSGKQGIKQLSAIHSAPLLLRRQVALQALRAAENGVSKVRLAMRVSPARMSARGNHTKASNSSLPALRG